MQLRQPKNAIEITQVFVSRHHCIHSQVSSWCGCAEPPSSTVPVPCHSPGATLLTFDLQVFSSAYVHTSSLSPWWWLKHLVETSTKFSDYKLVTGSLLSMHVFVGFLSKMQCIISWEQNENLMCKHISTSPSPVVCQLLQRTANHPGSLGGSVQKDDGRCPPSRDQLARVRLPGRERKLNRRKALMALSEYFKIFVLDKFSRIAQVSLHLQN